MVATKKLLISLRSELYRISEEVPGSVSGMYMTDVKKAGPATKAGTKPKPSKKPKVKVEVIEDENKDEDEDMDDLPAEIVANVGRLAGKEGLPAFRLTGRLAKNVTALHFAKICFNSFDISVTPDSLHKLALAVSHSRFGPQIQHVTFNISGTENMTPALFASSWSVFKAFVERGQKVTVQVKVNAIAIYDSAFIETNIHRFLIHVMGTNSLETFVEGSVTLNLPSPPKNPRDAPLRNLLFHHLAASSNTEDINISYSDVSPTAGLNYNTTTRTLLVEGLEVKHLFELQSFFKGLRLNKVIFKNTSIDTTTINKLCATHRPTLSSVSIENADLWDLWSDGDKAPASWKEALIDISSLPALKACSLTKLRKEWGLPSLAWDTVTVQQHPVQVSEFFASGIVTVHHHLELLINTTRW
ncbi:hypothetical protein KCV07_g5955, partial [Aureobasidium melanogenum]